jgi:hypothetical protein
MAITSELWGEDAAETVRAGAHREQSEPIRPSRLPWRSPPPRPSRPLASTPSASRLS